LSIDAFFFGPEGELFGIHQGPSARVRRGQGVVLCHPLGREYLRAHRSFRQLVTLLVRSGYDVLRFDYLGSGDSAGDPEAASIPRWEADIEQAVAVLRERTGLEEISLIGLRLGATLACGAAARLGPLRDLVLWDPVSAGPSYVSELKDRQGTWLEKATQQLPVRLEAYTRAAALAEATNGDGSFECVGFPITSAFRKQLEAIDLRSVPPPPARRVLLLETTRESAGCELHGQLSRGTAECTLLHHPARSVWLGTADATVPGDLLRRIVSWTAEGHA